MKTKLSLIPFATASAKTGWHLKNLSFTRVVKITGRGRIFRQAEIKMILMNVDILCVIVQEQVQMDLTKKNHPILEAGLF